MADKYLLSSFFTVGAKITSPTIFGTIIAKIIASENPMTEPKLAAAPMTTKIKNKIIFNQVVFHTDIDNIFILQG